MIDYKERRLRFWCQKVLPLVYDESLSYYELLCKIMKHLSEAETDVSALEQWLEELDAAAVKKVYSEWPLRARKTANTVNLTMSENISEGEIVTKVEAAENSPISVTLTSHYVDVGSLNPDDPDAPEGVVGLHNEYTFDIEPATTSARGSMSAEDKAKVDRLFNTTVVAGDNIVVTSNTSANGDTEYTVGVDPTFQPSIENSFLAGDLWEWNSMLDPRAACVYVSQGTDATWEHGSARIDNTQESSTVSYNVQNNHVLNGVFTHTDYYNGYGGSATTTKIIGYNIKAQVGNPFSRVSHPTTLQYGSEYYTTLDAIDIKGQFKNTVYQNRTIRIYLCEWATSTTLGNQYATHGDPYFPGNNVNYLPPYVTVTTDANGYFETTIPAGLTATLYQGGASSYQNPPRGILSLVILPDGDFSDLVQIVENTAGADLKVSVKSNLTD